MRSSRSSRWLIALAVVPLIPLGIYCGFVVPNERIEEELNAQGYKNVQTSMAFYPSHPFDFACSGKHPVIRNWIAEKGNVQYKGDACYSYFFGAKVWVDE